MSALTPAVIEANKIKFHDSRGEFDETWFSGVNVHIERMNESGFWIGFDFPDGQRVMLNTGVYRGEWFFNLQEDSIGGGEIRTVRRPRGSTKSDILITIQNELARLRAKLAKRDEPGRSPESWIIKYEDPDKPDLTFTGEGAEIAARSTFQRVGDNWSCRLFAEVASTGCGEY